MSSTALWLAIVLSGCSGGGRPAEERARPGATRNTLEKIRRAGVVRIAYSNEVPYAYYERTTGKLTGAAPEVARYVLQQMGVPRIEGVLTDFGSMIPGLMANRFDIIAAGMYITPTRCRQIAFSEPISCMGQAFLVKAGNPLGLHSYDDAAKNSKGRLGVVAGGVEIQYARLAGVPAARTTVFPDPPSALAGLQVGRIDALGGPLPSLRHLLNQAGDRRLERADPFREPIINGKPAKLCDAIGFRKEDTVLLEEFNRHLKKFIGSKEHVETIKPFGFQDSDVPSGTTAERLCSPWSP
jgi:polar amino acid transport system substrate-binding protein